MYVMISLTNLTESPYKPILVNKQLHNAITILQAICKSNSLTDLKASAPF